MLLFPKRVKYKKKQQGRTKGVATNCYELNYGIVGLKCLGRKWITSAQIEAARKEIKRHFKGRGKVWIRIFPDKPVTFKGNEVKMGGGKGMVDHYVYPIKPGRIIFEVDGVTEKTARQALEYADRKLPIKTKVIEK